MQYYNYRIDRRVYMCNMFKDTCLIAHKRMHEMKESDFDNFGVRITKIRVTVEKIWLKEVLGTYLQFWKVSRANFGKILGLYGKWWSAG
jgi:hypothetical protein